MWVNGQSDLFHVVTSPSRKPCSPRPPEKLPDLPPPRLASKRSLDRGNSDDEGLDELPPKNQRRNSTHELGDIRMDRVPFLEGFDDLQKSEEAVEEFGVIIDQCLRVLQLTSPGGEHSDGGHSSAARHRGLLSAIIASTLNLAVEAQKNELVVTKEAVNKALQRISNSRLTPLEQFTVGSVVHAAWTSSLLTYITDPATVPYVLLKGTSHEKVQILASCGARFILEKLNSQHECPSVVFRDVPKSDRQTWDVFLGGSCGHTTWRKDIAIPALNKVDPPISFFNPQVGEGEWSHELIAVEAQAKASSKVYLMVILADTAGMASMVEVAELCGKGRRVFLVCHEVKEGSIKNVSEEGRKDINRGRRYLIDSAQRASQRVTVYHTVEDAVLGVIQYLTEQRD